MTEISPLFPAQPWVKSDLPLQEARARAAAVALEASFLSEMLKSAGFGSQVNSFSGGAGEDHFASFHRDAIARRMVAAGVLGMAEQFFKSMMEAKDGT